MKPSIEFLEDRITPSTITWDGSHSNDWNNGLNWVGDNVPTVDDIAVIGSAPGDISISGGPFSVKALRIGSAFSHKLSIAANATLVIADGTDSSTPDMEAGELEVVAGGSLHIDGGSFEWMDGNITGDGTIYVTDTADFNVHAWSVTLHPEIKLTNTARLRFTHYMGGTVELKNGIDGDDYSKVLFTGSYGFTSASGSTAQIILWDGASIERMDVSGNPSVPSVILNDDALFYLRNASMTVAGEIDMWDYAQLSVVGTCNLYADVDMHDESIYGALGDPQSGLVSVVLIGDLNMHDDAYVFRADDADGDWFIDGDWNADGGKVYVHRDSDEGITLFQVEGDVTWDNVLVVIHSDEAPTPNDTFTFLSFTGLLDHDNTAILVTSSPQLWEFVGESLVLKYTGDDM